MQRSGTVKFKQPLIPNEVLIVHVLRNSIKIMSMGDFLIQTLDIIYIYRSIG